MSNNNKNKKEIIKQTYYDPRYGFKGTNSLFKTLKDLGYDVTREEIKEVLGKQEIYQTTKKNNQKSGSFVAPYSLYEFQVDLIYLENKHLNKASYGLVCIDTFSKKGDVELMTRKSAPQTVEAMDKY